MTGKPENVTPSRKMHPVRLLDAAVHAKFVTP